MKTTRCLKFTGLLAALTLVLAPLAPATVDDAHSTTMELAAPHVEKGFKVRQDYWKGEVKPGATKLVNHTLFKGNEYWFWFAIDADEGEVSLKVLDSQGNEVQAEKAGDGKTTAAVRVLPPKTGTYSIVFTVKKPGKDPVQWALAYGYR